MNFNYKNTIIIFLGLIISAALWSGSTDPVSALQENQALQTYYVDCESGNDSNTGLSESNAWRGLNRANQANLAPGDKLLFKRGCVFAGQLKASWNGTFSNPIVISAYGEGALPKIQNFPEDLNDLYHVHVRINGSYQIIEYLQASTHSSPVDPNCNNQRIGFYVGFSLDFRGDGANPGAYNTVRHSIATDNTIGIHLTGSTEGKSHHNVVTHNYLTNNNVMSVLTPDIRDDDLGSWGVLINGDNNDVSYNVFERNVGWCNYDEEGNPSNSIELYAASNNNIHHNVSINDRVFSEMGSGETADTIAANNLYAFNVMISDVDMSRFVVTRGDNRPFGPVLTTRVFNNTVLLTAPTSLGIVCGGDCDSNHLNARNNIVSAEEKVIFAKGVIQETNNIFWNSAGDPFVQLESQALDASSILADPKFNNVAGFDLTLKSDSPAINKASSDITWIRDRGIDIPVSGSELDIGSFEFGIESWQDLYPIQDPSNTPTPVSTATEVPVNTATPEPTAISATETPNPVNTPTAEATTTIPAATETPNPAASPTPTPTETLVPLPQPTTDPFPPGSDVENIYLPLLFYPSNDNLKLQNSRNCNH